MAYRLTQLNAQVVLITLTGDPTPQDDNQYVADVRRLLDAAPDRIYFVVDFRRSITSNVNTIRRLAQLTQHPKFGASVAFSSSRVRQVYAELYARLTASPQARDFYDTPQAALAALDSIQPGIGAGIDWDAVLAQSAAQH